MVNDHRNIRIYNKWVEAFEAQFIQDDIDHLSVKQSISCFLDISLSPGVQCPDWCPDIVALTEVSHQAAMTQLLSDGLMDTDPITTDIKWLESGDIWAIIWSNLWLIWADYVFFPKA